MSSLGSINRSEMVDLLLSFAVLVVAFSIIGERRMPGLDVILVTAVGVGTGFLLHELAHKFMAQRYGYWAEYHANKGGLAFIIVMALAGFIFAAPGAVWIRKGPSSHSPYGDEATLEGLESKEKREQLWISLAGPATNIILAILFLGLLISGSLPSRLTAFAASYAFFINLNLAAFNLLPLGPLDGRKVFASSPVVWAIVGIPTILAGLAMLFGAF